MVCYATSSNRNNVNLCVRSIKIEENHISAEEIGKGIKQDHHIILKYEMAVLQSLQFDLNVYGPYRAIEGFVSNMEEFLQAKDGEIQKLENLPKWRQQKLTKLCSQLALAALRMANKDHVVVDFDRYLDNIVSQPNSEHTTLELVKLLDDIESLVENYKYPSDMKHIDRKLKSCRRHSSSHDEYFNLSLFYSLSSVVRNGRRNQGTSHIGAPMMHQAGTS